MVHLVLSLDYEIFGNGAGDVVRDVVHPTNRLLDVCEEHGAKITIMFEVGEYWAFERYDERLQHDLGYSPSRVMQKQIIEAMERGHDVQLHLHPQWIGAEYDKGAWQLRHCCQRLADLPDGLGSEEQVTSIVGALARGKRTLEDVIQPVKADYECSCFRAGGFYAQPSHHIIRAMKRIGLRADSSVVKGHRSLTPFAVDYSLVETGKAAWWTTDMELIAEGKPGENIIELSVSSTMEPYWRSFKLAKLRAALRRRQIERAYMDGRANGNGNGISSVPSYRAVLRKMLTKHASAFDFCKLSCQDMLKRIGGLGHPQQQPVVMIGHAKDFINDRQFGRFLAVLSGSGSARFVTMSEIIQAMWHGPDRPGAAVTDAAVCHAETA